MAQAGRLGAYLLGHSPVDRAFLVRAGQTTAGFAAIVAAAPDDAAVLAALRAHGFDEDRLRRWSDRFPATYRRYIALWDLDEGYRTPNLAERIAMAIFRPFEAAVMGLVRRLRAAP